MAIVSLIAGIVAVLIGLYVGMVLLEKSEVGGYTHENCNH